MHFRNTFREIQVDEVTPESVFPYNALIEVLASDGEPLFQELQEKDPDGPEYVENLRVREIEDICALIKENVFVVLVGPTGAGKTTMVKQISEAVYHQLFFTPFPDHRESPDTIQYEIKCIEAEILKSLSSSEVLVFDELAADSLSMTVVDRFLNHGHKILAAVGGRIHNQQKIRVLSEVYSHLEPVFYEISQKPLTPSQARRLLLAKCREYQESVPFSDEAKAILMDVVDEIVDLSASAPVCPSRLSQVMRGWEDVEPLLKVFRGMTLLEKDKEMLDLCIKGLPYLNKRTRCPISNLRKILKHGWGKMLISDVV